MSIPAGWPQVLDFFGIPLVFERSLCQLPGDAVLLAAHLLEPRIRLARAFTEAMDGPGATGLTEYSLAERARARVVGILAGCQDREGHGNWIGLLSGAPFWSGQ
jgi:hypothetical protein